MSTRFYDTDLARGVGLGCPGSRANHIGPKTSVKVSRWQMDNTMLDPFYSRSPGVPIYHRADHDAIGC
jgi:hypothetical protein